MKTRLLIDILGGHAHVRVFLGKDMDHLGLSGTLVMSPSEANELVAIITHRERFLDPKNPADSPDAIY